MCNRGTMKTWPPHGWEPGRFPHKRHKHTYYVIDSAPTKQAPTVLLLHEFPGINEALEAFANNLATSFRVVVPSITGQDGSPSQLGTAARLCIRREVFALAMNRTSPAVDWLRHLVDDVVSPDGRQYGVIGMCMTGGFALALAVDQRVSAAVIAQPALPLSRLRQIPLPRSAERAADLGLSVDDRAALSDRVQGDNAGLCVRALRYADDWISPAARLVEVKALLGPDVVQVSMLTGPKSGKHSTLTGDESDEGAVREIVRFLQDRLSAPS